MINEYSYGHLMILEISSDQQKRPAGLIKRETGVNPVQAYPYCKRGRRITAIVRQDEKAFLG